MEQIRLKSNQLIGRAPKVFSRFIAKEIDWNSQLVGIIGPRGAGKTTLLLQQAAGMYGVDPKAIYISMNDIYLCGKSLRGFVTEFRSKGGRHIFIDDIQKYPQWSLELKNIYEALPDVKITFAGSSTIEMVKHYANLSQRAAIHNISTQSFREYLAFMGIANPPKFDFETLLENHIDIANEYAKGINANLHLDDYLTQGYYPNCSIDYEQYKREMESFITDTIEVDMPYLEGYDSRNIYKIKQLVNIIAQNAPFKPNLVKISDTIGVHRNTLIGYFFHLEKTQLISMLYPSGESVGLMQKPEKVFLGNPNIFHLLSPKQPDREAIIENFAISQLAKVYPIRLKGKHFIEVDGKWLLNISHPNQRAKKSPPSSTVYNFTDGYEIGSSKRIPLWLLGLLY
jgi:uncharacterized protein